MAYTLAHDKPAPVRVFVADFSLHQDVLSEVRPRGAVRLRGARPSGSEAGESVDAYIVAGSLTGGGRDGAMLGSAERRRYQAWRPARNRFQQLHAVDVFERACGIAVPGGELCILAQLLRLLEIRGVLIRGPTAGQEEEKDQAPTQASLKIGAHVTVIHCPFP